MAASWALVTLGLVALLIVTLLVSQQRSGPKSWPTWTLVLSAQAPGRRRYEDLAADLADDLAALRATLRLARRQSESGEWREADHALDSATRHVARHVPTVRERLITWRAAARVVSAVYPLPRLRVRPFRAWRLRSAAVGEALTRPALNAARQFTLRIYVLLYGLKLVIKDAPSRRQEALDADTLRRRLRAMEALGNDLGTLHGASLDVYRALLISLHERDGQSGQSSQ